MSTSALPDAVASSRARALRDADLSELQELVEHSAHLLPSQGPLSVFVHHNTLHALEHLPFADAVVRGGELYGCDVYLSEARYREFLARGRIHVDDLAAVLQDDLADDADVLIGLLGSRFSLRLAMLQIPLDTAPVPEIEWAMANTDAMRRFRADAPPDAVQRTIHATKRWSMREFLASPRAQTDDRPTDRVAVAAARFRQGHGAPPESWPAATWEEFTLRLLWETCLTGFDHRRTRARGSKAVRARDALFDATGVDADELVNEVLIPFCAAFLDQGVAAWTLPQRESGFFHAFASMYGSGGVTLPRWLRGLRDVLLPVEVTPLESIRQSLEALGVARSDREPYILATLIALRGWAGMLWQMETNAEWTVHPAPTGTLIEYVAVRLLLDRLAAAHVARDTIDYRGSLQDVERALRPATLKAVDENESLPLALVLFQLAQALGWSPEDLHRQTPAGWRQLLKEIEAFSSAERRRVLQIAYERRHRNQTLDALLAHGRPTASSSQPAIDGRPAFQVVCCLDEREESFRRHLEELAPDAETLGGAGFFGVAMYYRGVAEAHARPLCPVVVKPRHYVNELPVFTVEEEHRRRARTRRLLGAASHQIHRASRSLLGGALTALFGSMASAPLVGRILFPRAAAQIRRHVGRLVAAPQLTQLELERTAPDPGSGPGHVGYSLDEMSDIVEQVLSDLGLTTRLAPIVLFCGHGSSSMNNPHGSAYNCGACGGGSGGPNARAFAQMANDPRIRAALAERGLEIPSDVAFLGGYHNTCDDSVTYFDLDRLPPSHRECFERMRIAIDGARRRNAQERCRRFESAPLSIDPEAALRHVEARSQDLAQVRPELGHATNSMCIVGRRSRTRGLFLDRRAFLTSYDPTHDDAENSILTRVLQAVFPVCAGINLEYYFSYVDSRGWGCGSKLPHNITSLLGVMDGAASDLRPGLPWQMVEIHEPLRILFVIETTPAAMQQILGRNPPLAALCRNDWVQLATLDPESQRIDVMRRGQFERYRPETVELPEAASSAEWFRGWREHLGFATITQGDAAPPRG